MNNHQIDSNTNINLFIEHKINLDYEECGNEYIPIEKIPISLKNIWTKIWYELPREKKLLLIKQF